MATNNCILPHGAKSASMPGPYSMKVFHVTEARSHEKMFLPVESARQSLVFAPTSVGQVYKTYLNL